MHQRRSVEARFEVALDRTIATWTPDAERLWGWSAAEAIGRPVADLAPARNRERQRRGMDAALIEPYAPARRDVTAVHKDGREFRVALTLSVHQHVDTVRFGIAAVGINPTDWAETTFNNDTDRYRMILDQISDGCSLVDLWGNYLFANAAYCRMFGIPPDRVVGANFRDFFPSEVLPALHAAHAEVFRTGTPMRDYAFTFERDGRELSIEMSVSLERNAKGEPIGFNGISRDRTSRARAERELAEAKRAADSANRAKSEFLAHMSHEIRTPMNGIIGMSELALALGLPDAQRDYIATVHSSAESLLVLINDILDFSKIEAGKLEIVSVDFSLRSLLDEAIRTLALRAHDKHLELLVDVQADVPDQLVGDPHRLRQVLVNLVGNAIKFTDKGEVVVRVAAAPSADGRAPLHFAVTDTGIGIPAERQAAIFQAFMQADGSTTRRYGGTGLGLTISQQLVSLMGGRMWVESTAGAGSAFQFEVTLPVSRSTVASPYLVTKDELAGLTALVVEPNGTGLRIVAETLRRWGMAVMTASDSASAITAIEQSANAVNLAVIEMRLPGIRGVEFVDCLRRHPRAAGASVIVLTSADDAGDERDVVTLGNAGYLVKPAGQRALLDAVLSVLGKGMALAEVRELTPSAPPLPPPQILRVLVADDNAVNRTLAAHLLRRRGHEPTMVEDGRDAVIAVANGQYDVVLMDLQMPAMDGFEATAAIRANEGTGRTRLPIIALTAHAMTGDRERCLEAGMDGYVSKPIRPAELFEVIERVCTAARNTLASTTMDRSHQGADTALRSAS